MAYKFNWVSGKNLDQIPHFAFLSQTMSIAAALGALWIHIFNVILIDTFVIDDKMMKCFQSSIFMVNKSISFDGEQWRHHNLFSIRIGCVMFGRFDEKMETEKENSYNFFTFFLQLRKINKIPLTRFLVAWIHFDRLCIWIFNEISWHWIFYQALRYSQNNAKFLLLLCILWQ